MWNEKVIFFFFRMQHWSVELTKKVWKTRWIFFLFGVVVCFTEKWTKKSIYDSWKGKLQKNWFDRKNMLGERVGGASKPFSLCFKRELCFPATTRFFFIFLLHASVGISDKKLQYSVGGGGIQQRGDVSYFCFVTYKWNSIYSIVENRKKKKKRVFVLFVFWK